MSCNDVSSPLDMLKNLMHFRLPRPSDSLVTSILAEFYPDNILATRDIQKDRPTYHAMARLAKKNDLQKIDNCHMGARYRITLQGKCRMLCNKFRIRFLCLCIISEAYAVRKFQIKHGCSPSYSLLEMDRIFEGVYSQKTIRNSATILFAKKLAYPKSHNLISLCEDIMKELDLHGDILDELHAWIIAVPNCLNILVMEDPCTYNEIRRIK